jgi:hypothetical protein
MKQKRYKINESSEKKEIKKIDEKNKFIIKKSVNEGIND